MLLMPKMLDSLVAYVPFPAPGAPKIMRFVLGSSFLFLAVVFCPAEFAGVSP